MGTAPGGLSGGISSPYRAELPEEKQLIVDAGIPLFELAKTVQNYQGNVNDFGYFDVDVSDFTAGMPPKLYFRENWHRGPHSYIRYHANRRGFCFAFCPDDPDWYNRIMLAASIHANIWRIERYHTRDGMVSGVRATEEIMFIRDLTHRWCVKVRDKTVARFLPAKREDAVSEAEKIRERGENPRIVWGKIESIETLIRKYKWNWFFSSEFREIKQDLVVQTNNRFRNDTDAVSKKNLLAELVRGMDPNSIVEILQSALPKGGSAPAPRSPITESEGISLDEVNDWGTIRKFAKNFDVEIPKGTKMPDAKKMITDKIAEKAMEKKMADEAMNAASTTSPAAVSVQGEAGRYDDPAEETGESEEFS